MANAQTTDDLPAPGTAARATIADCDAKLDRYRAALDAGAAPTVITGWITQTQAERHVPKPISTPYRTRAHSG